MGCSTAQRFRTKLLAHAHPNRFADTRLRAYAQPDSYRDSKGSDQNHRQPDSDSDRDTHPDAYAPVSRPEYHPDTYAYTSG
jgi:hypothetical protein